MFSVAMIAGAVACVGYLVATGQALTLDGLFLALAALLLAAGFALYLVYMIRKSMEAAKAPAPAARPAAATAAKPAPVEG